MSWGGEQVDAYVASDGICVWRAGHPLSHGRAGAGLPRLDRALEAAGLTRRRWPTRVGVRVWLSGALAKPFLLRHVAGLKSRPEATAVAAARAAQEDGWAGEVDVWLDSLPTQRPALAVAVRSELVHALQRDAGRVAARVVSLRPWWTLALEAEREKLADIDAIAVEDSDSLVFLASDSESWHEAVTYEPRPAGAQAEAAVQRLVLALPSGAPRVRRARLRQLDAARATLEPMFVHSLADR